MGILDGPFRTVAKSLIGTLGTSAVTITRKEGDYDPATDQDATTTTTIAINISPPAPFKQEQVDGSAILSSDLMCYVSASDLDDESFDVTLGTNVTLSLEYDGKEYAIVAIKEMRSGDQVAAYELQLRK